MTISPFIPYKLLFHGERVSRAMAGELVFPISVEIDLSNVCPHDCPFCSFGTSTSQGYRQQNWVTFPFPRILALLQELQHVGVESVTFTGGGEPLIHTHAAEIFACATKVGLQWGLVTNGLLLAGEVARQVGAGATFVRISLDAGSGSTHRYTHGLPKSQPDQYERILSQIKSLRESTPKLVIGTSFCVMNANVGEILLATERVREAGGSYIEFRPTFPTDWRGDGWNDQLGDDGVTLAQSYIAAARDQYQNSAFRVIGMIERFDSLSNPAKGYKECRIGSLSTVIGADATIWHCCVQRGQDFFKLGDVKDQDFETAWTRIHQVRDQGKIDVGKCPRCRYDGYNEILEHAVLTDGMHRSFV